MLNKIMDAAKGIDTDKLVKIAKIGGTIATIGGGFLTAWAGTQDNKKEIAKQVEKFNKMQTK